jgi:hypothetical protein
MVVDIYGSEEGNFFLWKLQRGLSHSVGLCIRLAIL